jgi:hypothetical protein
MRDPYLDTEEFKAEYANIIFDSLFRASVHSFLVPNLDRGQEISDMKKDLQDVIDYFVSVEQYAKAYYVKLVNDDIVDPYED